MTYLASPYSSSDATIRHQRYLAAYAATLLLIRRGQVVFSPIVYSHQYAEECGTDFASWSAFDLGMIDAASSVAVLMLAGWRESVGVQAELRHARAAGKPVVFLDPVTLEPVDTLKIG